MALSIWYLPTLLVLFHMLLCSGSPRRTTEAGLARYGAKVQTVRVGRPEKIRPELEEITLDNRCKVRKQEIQETWSERFERLMGSG